MSLALRSMGKKEAPRPGARRSHSRGNIHSSEGFVPLSDYGHFLRYPHVQGLTRMRSVTEREVETPTFLNLWGSVGPCYHCIVTESLFPAVLIFPRTTTGLSCEAKGEYVGLSSAYDRARRGGSYGDGMQREPRRGGVERRE